MVRIPLPLGRKPGDVVPLIVPIHAIALILAQAWLVHEFAASELRFGPGQANQLAFALTALLVVSILLHEVGHAVAGREAGMPVYGIVFTGFGAATCLPGWAGPGKNLRATLGGPAVSATLAFCGALVYAATHGGRPHADTVGSVCVELFLAINLVLLVGNLLPGLPLDGGRIVQAAVWRASRDPVRAADVALATSVVVAVILDSVVAWLLLVNGDVAGAVSVGVFAAMVTWALPRARAYARGLRRVVRRTAGDVLAPNPTIAPAAMSPAAAWRELFKPSGLSAIPVLDADGRPVGRVTRERIRELCGDDRRTLAEFTEPWPVVRADLPVADLLRHPVVFDTGGILPVVDADGRWVGATCLLRVQQVALGA